MMLTLFLAQTAPVTPDIVVTSLRKLRLATTMEHGRLTGCTVRVSSGDAAIDREACQAMQTCVADGITASEPLANCIDTRIAAVVVRRADADPASK